MDPIKLEDKALQCLNYIWTLLFIYIYLKFSLSFSIWSKNLLNWLSFLFSACTPFLYIEICDITLFLCWLILLHLCWQRSCVTRRTVNPETFSFLDSDSAFISTRPESNFFGARYCRHVRHPSPDGLAEVCPCFCGLLYIFQLI